VEDHNVSFHEEHVPSFVMEYVQGGWIVARQDRAQAIAQAPDLFGEEVQQADFGAQLTDYQTIRTPGMQHIWVGAQDIGDQKRVTLIGVSIRLTIAPTSALDCAWWNDKHISIALIPQNVDPQDMRGLQSNLTLRAWQAQLLALAPVGSSHGGVRDGEAAQDLAALIEEQASR